MKFKIVTSDYLEDNRWAFTNFKEAGVLFILVDDNGMIHWEFPRWDSGTRFGKHGFFYRYNPKHVLCNRETIPNYYSCTRCTVRPPYEYVRYWKTLCNLQLDL